MPKLEFDVSIKEGGLKELNRQIREMTQATSKMVAEFGKESDVAIKAGTQLEKLKNQKQQLTKATNELSGGVKRSSAQLLEMGENITVVMAGIKSAISGVVNLGKESIMLSANLNVLRANFQGTTEDLELFRTATAGTVSDANLIKLSNQATDLGISIKEQPLLFSLAEDAADKYGGSVEENFSKVVMATEGNIRGLKSLGIQKEVYNKTVADLVKTHGGEIEMLQGVNGEQEINIKKLDPAIQKQIRLEAILKLTGVTLDSVRSKTQDQKDKLEAMSVKVEEAKLKFGDLLMKGVEPLVSGMLKMGTAGNIVVGGFTSIMGAAIPLAGTIAQLNIAFPTLLTSMGSIASITGIIGVGLANLVAHFNNINGVIDIFTGKIFESYKQSWAFKNLWGGDTTDSEANKKNENSWIGNQINRMSWVRNQFSKSLTSGNVPKMEAPVNKGGKSPRVKDLEEEVKAVEELHDAYRDLFSRIARANPFEFSMGGDANGGKPDYQKTKASATLKEFSTQWNEVISSISDGISGLFESIASGGANALDGFKNFLKSIANAFITTVEAMLFAAQGGSFAKAILSLGASLITDMPWTVAGFVALEAARGIIGSFADGGLIQGAGTGRSDSNLARVSNGEFIMNAESTRQNLPFLMAMNSGSVNNNVYIGSSIDGVKFFRSTFPQYENFRNKKRL